MKICVLNLMPLKITTETDLVRLLSNTPVSYTHLFADEELMRAAYVEPPQVVALAAELARDVSPEFAGVSQVSGIVDLTEEMVNRD